MSLFNEGPDHKTHTKVIRQVGWLGAPNEKFYPWGTPLETIHAEATGSYSPVYIEVEDD